MAKQIYYLFSCDEWKGTDSMTERSLLFIGTSQKKLKMAISKEIENGDMEYGNIELSHKEQAKNFRKDWEVKTRNEINSNLQYGYYDYTYDNMVIH